jgi:hypothetical protein
MEDRKWRFPFSCFGIPFEKGYPGFALDPALGSIKGTAFGEEEPTSSFFDRSLKSGRGKGFHGGHLLMLP